MTPDDSAQVHAVEVRLLEGPNLYFTRPAVKVSLGLPGYVAADEAALQDLAAQLRLPRSAPGAPGTETRQRFLLRLVERVVRRLARSAGNTRLGVRVRPGSHPEDVVVAAPWQSRARGQALGEALAPLLETLLRTGSVGNAFEDAAAPLRELPREAAPRRVLPKIPVISITGTNGKTTTTRLVAHIGMTAGLRTGWSSTDGVLVQGELIERGDYSGPAGARTVLEAPGVQLAVLETARGGMLFKGLGVPVNDVSLVTNVSADHLGQQGIDTIDQLAEVKAIITKVTRPMGWVVLNGDDPRVWAMRAGASGQVWCFSLDSDSPSLREAVQAGGRAITVLDGDIVVLAPGRDPQHLIAVADVPMTLSGLSVHNVANALAGAAGALGLGLTPESVAEGLRTFTPDADLNPGRMNIYSVPLAGGGAVTVILDMAHNESGLESLLTVAEGLRSPGHRVILGLGTGGDRTDDILGNLGEMAGLRADVVHIVHKEHYLRGRTVDDLTERFKEGLARAGVVPVAVWPDELSGLQALLAEAHDGDVLPVMVHSDREELHEWLLAHDASSDGAVAIRTKVLAARQAQPSAEQPSDTAQDDADPSSSPSEEITVGTRRALERVSALLEDGRTNEARTALDAVLGRATAPRR